MISVCLCAHFVFKSGFNHVSGSTSGPPHFMFKLCFNHVFGLASGHVSVVSDSCFFHVPGFMFKSCFNHVLDFLAGPGTSWSVPNLRRGTPSPRRGTPSPSPPAAMTSKSGFANFAARAIGRDRPCKEWNP